MKNMLLKGLFLNPEMLDKYTNKGIDKHISKGMINNDFSDQKALTDIYHQIERGEYKIAPSHTSQIPKDDGTMRTVYINEGFDRVILAYYNDMFFKYCHDHIHPQCKSYQTGIGTSNVVREISKILVTLSDYEIGVKLDLSKYFDTPKIEYIDKEFDYIRSRVGEDIGIDKIQEFYHMNWVFDLDKNLIEHYHSLGQGVSTASYFADALLYHIDKEITENYDVYYVRYSDDICIVGKEWRKAYERVSEMLSEMDLTLNPKKVEVLTKDHYFKFLGYSLRNGDITISKGRLKKFVDAILEVTVYSERKSLKAVINDVHRVLYSDGDYCWADMLRTITNKKDINTINGFIMDCIRAWYFKVRKMKDIGGLGYENRPDKDCVVSRGKGNKIKSMRLKMPEIDGFLSLNMMRILMIMDKRIFKSKLMSA